MTLKTKSFENKILCNSEIIQIRNVDHYTLICENAHAVAEFHVRILGFNLLRTIDLNTGTVTCGDIDMKNYILQPPGNPLMTLVVTEGLNDKTMFRRYMKAHGEGIHHIAFRVDDIEQAFSLVQSKGILTTSDHITNDPLSGLKQFFIRPAHSGFFIELVERPNLNVSNPSHQDEETTRVDNPHSMECDARDNMDNTDHTFFSNQNMIDLSRSMKKILDEYESDEGDENWTANNGIFSTEGAIEYDALPNSFFNTKIVDGVGALRSFGFSVKNQLDSMHFLLSTFNFRFIQCNAQTGRIYLQLQDTVDNDSIFLMQAKSQSEERRAIVDLTFPDTHFPISSDGTSSHCITIPMQYTTYTTNLCSERFLSSMSSVIEFPNATDVAVQIQLDLEEVVTYLTLPSNLTKWTGHKAIHFSSTRDEWVETRSNNCGLLVDYVMRVQREGDSVIFNWPERNLSMRFVCTRVASYHQFTKVQAVIPTFQSEKRQANVRRVIAIELDLLKAILEGDTSCISDNTFQQIQCFHLEIYGVKTARSIPPTLLKAYDFRGEIYQEGKLYELMSTDFACTIRSKPLAVLIPSDIHDVKIAIRLAFELGISLAVRGSQVSHSAGGQSQSNNGLLLDISNLSSIRMVGQASMRVGAGAMWNDVINFSLKRGLMPPVVNDYQYLSVGGTISMGGVGFMSHLSGVQAAHVEDLEIVTGVGDVLHCSSNINTDAFNLARGGLGQFGVLTSLTLPLVRAPKEIITLKIFFSQINGEKYFVESMERLVGLKVDMLHAFVKPSSKEVISAIVGKDEFLTAPTSFQNAIEKGERNGEIVYFVELGVFIWADGDTAAFDGEDPLINLRGLVSSELNNISAVYFEEKHDFSSYLRRDPPVIETNKEHGIVPHPSFAAIHSKETTQSLLNKHIESQNRGDDGTNEILIMPLKDNSELLSGNPTPMFSFPKTQDSSIGANLYFFILFLGSAITNEKTSQEDTIEMIRDHHRSLHNYSHSIGGKRYCYDTITSEVRGEHSWKYHYGDENWKKIVEGKKEYDPYHLFQSVGLNIFS